MSEPGPDPVRLAPSWRGVVAISLGAFALVVTEFLPVGLLPEISQDLGVSEGTTGLAVTATALLGAFAAPATAVLIGRLDRRLALLGLTALLIISAALSAASPSFAVLIIARVLLGAGVGGFWAISITAAGRLVPPEKIAKASAMVLGGISIGSVVSVPIGAYLGAHADWRTAFVAATVLAVLVAVLQAVLLPRIPMDQPVSVSSFVDLLRLGRVRLILTTVILIVAGHYVAYTYVTPLLLQVGGFSADVVSVLLLGYGAVTVIGNFVAGALAARTLFRTVAVTAALFIASLLVMAIAGGVQALAVAALAGWALALGMTPVSTQLWLFDAAKHSPEAAQAMNTGVFQLSIGLGSLAGSVTVTATGSVHTAVWVSFVVLTLAGVVVTAAGKQRRAGSAAESRSGYRTGR